MPCSLGLSQWIQFRQYLCMHICCICVMFGIILAAFISICVYLYFKHELTSVSPILVRPLRILCSLPIFYIPFWIVRSLATYPQYIHDLYSPLIYTWSYKFTGCFLSLATTCLASSPIILLDLTIASSLVATVIVSAIGWIFVLLKFTCWN